MPESESQKARKSESQKTRKQKKQKSRKPKSQKAKSQKAKSQKAVRACMTRFLNIKKVGSWNKKKSGKRIPLLFRQIFNYN